MISLETIAKVRRDHFVHAKSIKQICRERGLSRNSVRKILRSNETAPRYERPDPPRPKLGAFLERLDAMLEANEKRSRRERFRLTRIHDDLRREGYEGGDDAVRRHAQRWRRCRHGGVAEAFIPLAFAPGEAYQFDWSHEYVLMGGVVTKVKVAHLRLCHSRMRFLVAYPRETREMVFDAHDRAFAFFGGACARGIYDNMPTAVDAVFVGKERRFNRGFERLCSHHLVEPTACTPAAGWEKGQVENQVKTSREAIFTPRLRVASYAELNAVLRERALAHAERTRHPEMKDRTVLEVFEAERAALVPWQGAYDGYAETTVAVSKTCLVSFDRNRYSVSAAAVGRPVQVRAYAERVVMLQDGAVVGEHARVFGRDRTVYDPWHYVPVLERKPGALRNGAPFKRLALPPAMTRVQARLAGSRGGERQMVELLMAAHRQGLEAVEAACAEALEAGLRSADAVLNILARRSGEAPAETLTPSEHLRLREEPVADCARYDRLIAGARRGAA
jgi:transposase